MGERKEPWFIREKARWFVLAVIVVCVQVKGCEHDRRLTALEAAQKK